MNQKITKTIFGAMLVSFGLQSVALAAPGDFSFSQSSPFGEGPEGTQCPFCDSTVSFTMYETIDDWTQELNFNPTTLLGSTSGTEDYLLLYQVVNTDPIFPGEDTLQRFLVSVNEGANSYFGNNPYKSGGYIENIVFDEASSAITPLDTPADGQVDSILAFSGFKTLDSAVEPDSITYGEIADNAVQALNGPTPTNGITFLFDNNPIPITDLDPMAPGGRGTSSLLFLTVDKDFVSANISSDKKIDLGLTWGRTQRLPAANGTSGDVVGVTVQQVPEPNAIVGLFVVGILKFTMKLKRQGKLG
ncbi:MAG: hypothetical protein QNJ65_15755 [Xenococcaceae cyanobacterium MO_234.B1]|nr:hypothetical protein [Xenococcaceae cyanobacterium MO_234.B1]